MGKVKRVIVKTVQCRHCLKWFTAHNSMTDHILLRCETLHPKPNTSDSQAPASSSQLSCSNVVSTPLPSPTVAIVQDLTTRQMPVLTPMVQKVVLPIAARPKIDLSSIMNELERPEKRPRSEILPEVIAGTEDVDEDLFSNNNIMKMYESTVANDRVRFHTLFEQMHVLREKLDSGKEVPDFTLNWPRMADNLRELGLVVTLAAVFARANEKMSPWLTSVRSTLVSRRS